MRKTAFISLFMIMVFFIFLPEIYACPTCGCTVCMLGKSGNIMTESSNKKWYFRYIYDQFVWHQGKTDQDFKLQNQGHDVHDKTTDITYHFELGRHVTDNLNVLIDVPYMVRYAIEIVDPDHLGERQRSQGFSDVELLGDYRFWHNANNSVSLAAGIKFPTGDTHQKSPQGDRFETDKQPGSGAYNYIVGGIYKFQSGRFSLTANTSRVFTTKGAQGFEFGDLYTASLEGDYLLNPKSKHLKTQLGLNTVFQSEWKEKTNGTKNPDSSGQTVLMGPSLKIFVNPSVSVTGTFLYPISQKLNGFTQEQGFDWTLGMEVRF